MEEKASSPAAPRAADASPARAKKRRRARAACACATPEACFACGRCLERHCVCGGEAPAAQRRLARLCRESRACNCRVLAPASARCELCMGCRRAGAAAATSHCRCVAHQQQLKRSLQHDDKKPACGCFQDKHALGTATAQQIRERRSTLARVKRRAGLPSSRGLYAKKIVAPGVGVDEFGEDCVELSDGGEGDWDEPYGHAKATGAEELLDVMPAAYIENSRPFKDAHEPQARLSWSRSQPYQQAMAAPPIRHTADATVRHGKDNRVVKTLNDKTIDRALENAVFERERDAAMPSENLVDYLIFAASVKASRIPELIGSLDDTAATALGVVAEEYMKQLVVRSTREPLCAATKRSVQVFAMTVLRDFNYATYLQKCELPVLAQLSIEQTDQVVNDLSHLVYDEFMALQLPSVRKDPPPPDQVVEYIREIVAVEMETARMPPHESAEMSSKFDPTNLRKLKAVKLSQHTSKVTGQRVYKYEVSADVGGKHHAKVVVDGFESREGAEQSIKRMYQTLDEQDKRLSEIENPSPPSPPKVAEDPIIRELYEQLVNQVRQSRTSTVSKTGNTTNSFSGDDHAHAT